MRDREKFLILELKYWNKKIVKCNFLSAFETIITVKAPAVPLKLQIRIVESMFLFLFSSYNMF